MKTTTALMLASMLVAAPTAAISQTTYTYTGNPFDTFVGTDYNGQSVSGSFVLDTPLGPNFSGSVTPVSFSFSGGVTTITQANATSGGFTFTTDGNGQITTWSVGAGLFQPSPPIVGSLEYTIGTAFDGGGFDFDSATTQECTTVDFAGFCTTSSLLARGRVNNNPGTWSVTTVANAQPVPGLSLLGLLMAGLGLLWIGRNKLRA